MKHKFLTVLLAVTSSLNAWAATSTDPQPVVDLVNRVCGSGASANFTFTLDTDFNGGVEAFQLGGSANAVTVKANTLSALTTGLNWYLNHDAHVNISWNNLRETPSSYPAPADQSVHAAKGKYRYYLNYCTFSYSMSFWNEDRWMKEIDWMALHGVNLPLQIVGMDAVWYYMLREKFGFSHAEATAFVAGPAFQGWWLMHNITGHGGNNPEWWYKRQAELGRKITDRMRELGMEPCLPGYVGMAPQKYVSDTGATSYSGSWNAMASPLLIDPGTAYTNMATQYYAYINKVYDFMPTAFSIDPCHERNIPSGYNYTNACNAARDAMNAASPGALWVAQEWQTNADQARINALPVDNTLLLDLSSERLTYKGRYGSHKYLFCMLHNYGGNVGMYGCMQKMLTEYTSHLSTGTDNGSNGTLVGVGATPEGIETNSMLYDLLFELPWLSSVPSPDAWLADYTVARYGVNDNNAKAAWENLRTTVYNNANQNQQGCREPVFCARPNLSGNGASSWANASYNWDKTKIIEAAYKLLATSASGANYSYDAVDFARQALTDYAHTLQMDMAKQAATGERFAQQAEAFLALMDDIDALLGTVSDFRMGKWAGAARDIATESGNDILNGGTWAASASDANWLEANARMLVTTWGNSHAATNSGGLRDYGNREWQGLISDYYKPRWVRFFNDMKANGSCGLTPWQWMVNYELPYVYGKTIGTAMSEPSNAVSVDAAGISYPQSYSATASGDPVAKAAEMMAKYFGRMSDGASYYSPYITNDLSKVEALKLALSGKAAAAALAEISGKFGAMTTGATITSYCFDLNRDGNFSGETEYTAGNLPDCPNVNTTCRITTSDGAYIILPANVGDGIAPEQVTLNGWTYNCSCVGLDMTLTSVVSGSGACVIPASTTVDGNTFSIVALGPDCFKDNKAVTSVSLPATLTSFGANMAVQTATLAKVDGVQRHYKFAQNLSKTGKWSINVKAKIGAAGFNSWGSLCFAPDVAISNPSSVYPGLEFYQNTPTSGEGQLHVMPAHTIGDATNVRYIKNNDGTIVKLNNKTVSVNMAYDNGAWTLHVTSDAGDDATFNYTKALSADLQYLNFQVGSDSEVISVTTTQDNGDASQLTQTITGNGATQTFNWPVALKHSENWKITTKVTTDLVSYNQWGSGLLAVGSDPLAVSYNNAFQLYLKAAGTINLKYSGNTEYHIADCTLTAGETNTVTISHIADGATTFTVQNATGATASKEVANTFADFTTMSNATKSGTTIVATLTGDAADRVRVALPFEGCTNLNSIEVAEGNTAFASNGGALYNADKTVLRRVPEGHASVVPPTPGLAEVSATALTGNTAAKIGVKVTQVGTIKGLEDARTALYIYSSENNAAGLARLDGTTFPAVRVVRPAVNSAIASYVLPFAVAASDFAAEIKTPKDLTVANGKVTLNFNTNVASVAAGNVFFLKSAAAANAPSAMRKAAATDTEEELEFVSKTIASTITPTTVTGGDATLTFNASYDNTTAAAGSYVLTDKQLDAASGAITAMTPTATITGATPETIALEGETEPEPTDWPAVTANGDRTGDNAKNQRLSTLAINSITIYTKTGNLDLTDPADGPQIIVEGASVPEVHPGQTITVSFTGTNMQHTRLSAYFDKNLDKQFQHTADYSECLGYIGARKQNGANGVLNSTSFEFTVPEDTPLGTTCLRLRFDGSWMETASGLSDCISDVAAPNLLNTAETNYPVKPDYSTNRTVYDVHLNVVNAPITWSTILETGSSCTDADEKKNHDSGAWLTKLTINDTDIYTNADADPVQTIIDAVSTLTLKAGETYNVAWTANDQMKWARLTVYFDTDGDGTFIESTSASQNDCVGVLGDYRPNSTTGNAFMPSSGFTFTVPNNAIEGVTCLRLRFDDAWQQLTGVAASAPNLAEGATNKVQPILSTRRSSRNVYDVHLSVVAADVFTGITVVDESETTGLGTIDVTGYKTYYNGIYTTNGKMTLTATPKNSETTCLGWWQEYTTAEGSVITQQLTSTKSGNKVIVEVKPTRDNVKYFTRFSGRLQWSVDASNTIYGVINGDTPTESGATACATLYGGADITVTTLSVPTTFTYQGVTYQVTRLDTDFLDGNATVRTLNLPKTVSSVGSDMEHSPISGDTKCSSSKQQYTWPLGNNPISGSEWHLAMRYTNSLAAGTLPMGVDVLLCSGTDPTESNPELKLCVNGGKLCFQTGSTTKELFDVTAHEDVLIFLDYSACRLHVTALAEDGTFKEIKDITPKWDEDNYDVTNLSASFSTAYTLKQLGYNYIIRPHQFTYGPGEFTGSGEDRGHETEQTTRPALHQWLNLAEGESEPMDNTWDFTITATVEYSGNHYNKWGTNVLATGTDPVAVYYTNGFQLYATGPGHHYNANHVFVKTAGTDPTPSTDTLTVGEPFDFIITHKGSSTTTYVVKQGEREIYRRVTTDPLSNIYKFCTDVVEGTNIRSLILTGSRPDMTPVILNGLALEKISVNSSSPYFEAKDGVLYSKGGELLIRVPANAQGIRIATEKIVDATTKAFASIEQTENAAYLSVPIEKFALIPPLPATYTCIALSQNSRLQHPMMSHARVMGVTFPYVTITDRFPSSDAGTKWNTFCLPFSLTKEAKEELFGEVRFLNGIQVDDRDPSFILSLCHGATEAGMPYFARLNTGVDYTEAMTFHSKSLSPALKAITIQKENDDGTYEASMYGNYDWKIMTGEGNDNTKVYDYIINNNYLYYVNSRVNLRGYRAYLHVEQPVETPRDAPKVRTFSLRMLENSGITTEVEDNIVVSLAPVDVYNLQGQCVRSQAPAENPFQGLPKGIYIINGKKVSNK